jgi:hypothetical protein
LISQNDAIWSLRTGVLAAELVAGEAHDHQAAVAVVFPQLFQPLELRREAAGAGGVDDEQDLAALSPQMGRLGR